MRFAVVLFFTLVVFPVTASFGEDQPGATSITPMTPSDANLYAIKHMLDNHEYRTEEGVYKIQNLAKELRGFQREQFYDNHKVSGWWGLLNIYWVGSLIQGDPLTSLEIFAGETGGLILAGYGAAQHRGELEFGDGSGYLVVAGESLALISIAYGQVRPWYYADEQNTLLRRALY